MIITEINKFLNTNNLNQNIKDIFTYSDPAQCGVIKFKSEMNKKSFYRKLKTCPTWKLEGGRDIKFSNKLTLQERSEEKRLGQIKYRIMQKDGMDKSKVKIIWKKTEVKYNGVRVFWIDKHGQRKYEGEAADIKGEVEDFIKQWLEARGGELSE